MTSPPSAVPRPGRVAGARRRLWLQRGAAGVVAGVAAYVSYDHQWAFALGHGARGVAAAVWPLSVDGLLVLACWRAWPCWTLPCRGRGRGCGWWCGWRSSPVWLSRSRRTSQRPAIGRGPVCWWPGGRRWPCGLGGNPDLLRPSRHLHRDNPRRDNGRTGNSRTVHDGRETGESVSPDADARATVAAGRPDGVAESDETGFPGRGLRRGEAQRVMWEHYRRAAAAGHTPTGAELDRIAGTRDYGRAVLARWRRTGRIPAPDIAEPVAANSSEHDSTVDKVRAAVPVSDSTEATGPNETPTRGPGRGVSVFENYYTAREPEGIADAGESCGRRVTPVTIPRAPSRCPRRSRWSPENRNRGPPSRQLLTVHTGQSRHVADN